MMELHQAPRYDGIFTPWIYVRDTAAAAAWYSRVLGLEPEFRLDDHGWCELDTGIDRVAIGLHQADPGDPGDPGGQRGGATLTLGVLDLDAELSRLEELGVCLDGPVTTIPGMIKMASFRDPDGNPLMLCQVLRTPRHDMKPR
jgi:predicted enzyme related to lactoylglutathione lyase